MVSADVKQRPHPHAELRARYAADLADGLDRFFEPPVATCPWCGGGELAALLTGADLMKCKPGRFTLQRCRSCGHVFQNPRLNAAGLEFYYRDVYDGLGAKRAERLFRAQKPAYYARARLVRAHASPRRWLDVGTGHGHFPAVASQVLSATTFDGLDMSEGVETAWRLGRIAEAYRGQFPDLAAELVGRYDGVSMNHYLEHTTDPFTELDAASTVLRPGGHLLIELPDPQSRLRLLGRYWSQWCQPQHLNLFPCRNLRSALTERGFSILAEQHGRAHLPFDFTFALVLAVNSVAPDPTLPWLRHDPTWRRKLLRRCALAGIVPLVPLTLGLDVATVGWVRLTDGGNVFRLLARKR
jgi:SAM-dependent methyltransferase